MQNIVITGADGRMGRALIEAVLDSEGVTLSGAVVKSDSAFDGFDAGELVGRPKLGITVTTSLQASVQPGAIIIDFTAPEATLAHLAIAKEMGCKMIIGTTGFNEEQLQAVRSFQNTVAMVMAGNFSVGVNLTLQLLRLAASIIGDSSDIEVIEAHHRHKVDAPSGTALMMGQAIAGALEVDLKDVGVFSREGITGAREKGSIGFSTIRGGDIVGEHTVLFASEGERVEISHKASSRQTFARGAVRAASWLAEKNEINIFDMEDVLGFSKK